MSFRRVAFALALSSGLLGFTACQDDDYEAFTATLEGAQEVPARTSSGGGTAVVLLSRRGDRADVSVTFNGGFTPTQAHIHRGARGTNGPVIFWLFQPGNALYPSFTEIRKDWTSTPADSRDEPFSQRIIDDLRAGNLYVNFHSSTAPGGEVRGQLGPGERP
jgi:hypothetical protein